MSAPPAPRAGLAVVGRRHAKARASACGKPVLSERIRGAKISGVQVQLNRVNGSPPATDHAFEEAALDAVLEHIPGAAVVCDQRGAIARSNGEAQRLLAADAGFWDKAIARAIRGQAVGAGISVTELSVPGHPPHFLIVARTGGDRVGLAVDAARGLWGLRAREAQVLAKIAQGHSNRAIAAQLGLAERTVELHITSLLRKAKVESRAQLIIALWELSDGT